MTKAGFDPLADFGGSLFQLQAIDDACREDPPDIANIFADRVTNGMMGYGLVEAIPDFIAEGGANSIEWNADNPPSLSVSGEVNLVGAAEDPPMSPLHAGRFGWKAHAATMMTFSAGASLNEIGITTPLKPTDNDPNGIDNPPDLASCDSVADPEEDMDFLQELTDFQRFLAAPPQTPKSGMTGETIFNNIGCADCHIASFVTPNDPMLELAIRNKVVKPYSDFLLHDMGPTVVGSPTNGGADGIGQGAALPNEIKTAPLMGLRMRAEVWHDGRFADPTRITDAIVAHNEGFNISEGTDSAQVGSQASGMPLRLVSRLVP